MEFVTFDGLRFPIKFLDGRPYVQDAGGHLRVLKTYDSWVLKPKAFRVYIDGIAFHGKIRVTAGSRRASRMITIYDMGFLGFAGKTIRSRAVIFDKGIAYRYGAIIDVNSDESGDGYFRVRLDPIQ